MSEARPFPSSLAHLVAEVARVEVLLSAHVLALSLAPPHGRRGPEERIHALLDRARVTFDGAAGKARLHRDDARDIGGPSPMPRAEHAAPEPSPTTSAVRAEADRMARDIAARRAATEELGTPLRLAHLAERCGLDRTDVDLLLLALAPEVGTSVIDGSASPSASPSASLATAAGLSARPTVGLALGAIFPSIEAQLAARPRLAPSAPLLRHALVRLGDDLTDARLPLPSRPLEIDPRIAAYLFGDDALDPRIAPFARLTTPARSLETLLLPADLRHGLIRLAASSPIVSLLGPYGSGRRSVAEALCTHAGCALVTVECSPLLAAGDDAFARAAMLAAREALLAGAAIHWVNGGAALEGDRPAARAALVEALRRSPGLAFVSGEVPWEPAGAFGERHFAQVELPRPTAAQQALLWTEALGERRGDDVDLPMLTSMFRFTGGQIHDVAAAAKNLARFRDPSARVAMSDVTAACRSRHGKRIGALARHVPKRRTWDDLVLPADRKGVLRELCFHVRHRSRVLGDWGFERKLELGKGLSALFSGPPGTGKTMAAGVIAAELGVALFHIDLSSVVSKFIGETEKHLAELFADAEASNAALFFDEADALFGKRTEVKDAHDRYANMETSYLLQRIEQYEGVVLLATNFLKNIDEAFVRRLAFVVEFPFPGAGDRLRIWQGIWTPETPLDRDVDLAFLAERVELSGGYIRNIALAAAFLAAEEGAPVAMRHLLHATRREFQKMGKVVDLGTLAYPR